MVANGIQLELLFLPQVKQKMMHSLYYMETHKTLQVCICFVARSIDLMRYKVSS